MLTYVFSQINLSEPAVDSLAKASDIPAEKTLSIIELTTSGGVGGIIIMLSLFVLSIITVYIFIERYITIKRAAQEDLNFMNEIKDFIHDGKLEAARSLCKSTPTPISRMIEKGVNRIGKPLNDIAAAIENTGKLELFKLEKNLATLATISGAAPMIGFLGTVIGMILAFHQMASAGGNIDVEMLSEGIYTAMVTTVAGLIVGIVAFIGYNLLVAKVEKVVFKMEARTTEFLDILNEPVK
ncbi:MAG: MotA/TolQ/ExbB proton channel family protein [Bacteroidetes bacterium]|nr:MAG: MotA/TolQ/ExbB proton channel family protein [Bacteroidota bacterium]MBL1144059.1 MotA/TolQ/ExbB proton channel family protein [Bacteroidota bacterium]NOG56859.1 MotA/TolQ/ExbB proton channel family protein [Bacteroidota bacterium]